MKFSKITASIILLFACGTSFAQDLFTGKKVIYFDSINVITHYLYKGDKIVMNLKSLDNKPLKKVSFTVDNRTPPTMTGYQVVTFTRGKEIKRWDKARAVIDTFDIKEDNAYFFWFEPAFVANRIVDISYTRIPAPGKEESLLTYIWETQDGKEVPVPQLPVKKEPVKAGDRDRSDPVIIENDKITQSGVAIGNLKTTIHDSYQNVVGNVSSKVYSAQGKQVASIIIKKQDRYNLRKVSIYTGASETTPIHRFEDIEIRHQKTLRTAVVWLVKNGHL